MHRRGRGHTERESRARCPAWPGAVLERKGSSKAHSRRKMSDSPQATYVDFTAFGFSEANWERFIFSQSGGFMFLKPKPPQQEYRIAKQMGPPTQGPQPPARRLVWSGFEHKTIGLPQRGNTI